MSAARRAGVVSFSALAGLVLLVCTLDAAAPRWTREAGLDVWNVREEMTMLEREKLRNREIDSNEEDLADRVAAGNSVARSVRERRIEWEEAVEQIGEINRGRAGFMATLRVVHPQARTERDLYAAYLRGKVQDQGASVR